MAKTRERCLTAEVMDSLTPAQNVVKIVLDELIELLGATESKLVLSNRIPNVIMLVGLQGSGKTTAAVKLAYSSRSRAARLCSPPATCIVPPQPISLLRLPVRLACRCSAATAHIPSRLPRIPSARPWTICATW